MYLLLPSLEEKRFINISVVSQAEASAFAKRFTDDVKASRKLKAAADDDEYDDITFYSNHVDLDSLTDSVDRIKAGFASESDIEASISLIQAMGSLAVSEVRGVRGARAIFVNPETNTVGVGTTVVYNRNWATLNFEDVNMVQLIQNTFLNYNLIETVDDEPDLGEDDLDEGFRDLDKDTSWY